MQAVAISCQEMVIVLPTDPHSKLVSGHRAKIRQNSHVRKSKRRPSPTVRFAADDRQRAGTLGTQCEKYHDRQCHGYVEHRPILPIPSRTTQFFAPGVPAFHGIDNCLVVYVVHDSQGCHDDLAGRQRGQYGTADAPIPTKRPDDRLDHTTGLPQIAVLLLLLM